MQHQKIEGKKAFSLSSEKKITKGKDYILEERIAGKRNATWTRSGDLAKLGNFIEEIQKEAILLQWK